MASPPDPQEGDCLQRETASGGRGPEGVQQQLLADVAGDAVWGMVGEWLRRLFAEQIELDTAIVGSHAQAQLGKSFRQDTSEWRQRW